LSTDFDRWREAEPMLKRAIQLDPSNSELRCRYAVYLGRIGRHNEAVQEARTAVALNAGDYDSNHQLIVELNRARNFEEALAQAKELVRLRSTEPEPYAALGRAYEWTGRFPEAEAALLESERYSRSERNRYTALAHRVTLLAAEGHPEKARPLAEQIYVYWKGNPFEANLLLSAYGKLGDKDRVAEILDAAYQKEDATILAAYTNPYLASIRADPKLLPIFRRLRFVP
jgi:Flp pilus assembly protein TadD